MIIFYFLETCSYSPKLTEGRETNIPLSWGTGKKRFALFSVLNWILQRDNFLLILRQYKTWYWDKKKIRSLREKKINTPNYNLRIIWVLEIDIGILQLFKVFNFTRTNAFCHLKTLSRSLFPNQIIPHKVLWKLQTIKSKKT